MESINLQINNWTTTPESMRDKENVITKLTVVQNLRKSILKKGNKDLEYIERCNEIIENLKGTISKFKK